MLTVSLLFLAQDLFDRSRRPEPEVTRSRDRIALRLSPSLDFPKCGATRKAIGIEAEFNANFSCNSFDVGASFRTLFDQNVREEFLGGALSMLEDEIATNALHLACQVSPTLCDLIKHYRLAANAMLQMQYQQCQTLEEVLDGAQHRMAADLMSRCLDEQQKQGKSLPEAMAACKKFETLPNLSGKNVKEVDLLKELGDLLQLGDDARALLDQIGQPLEMTGKSSRTRLQLGGLEPVFSKVRDEFEAAWNKALEEAARGPVREETLRKLVPEGSDFISGVEVAWLGLLPDDRRAAVLSSVATASALAQLARGLHEIERALETAEYLPNTESWRPELEKRRKWIRRELDRLEEAFRYQKLFNASLADANALTESDARRLAADKWSPVVARRLEDVARRDTRPWGGGTASNSTKKESSCTSCGVQDYGFGNVRGRKP